MKRYYRVMLGKKSLHSDECVAGGFIGSGFGGLRRDVSTELTDDFRSFNKIFIPEMHSYFPDKSKVALGLWCGFAWTICKGIRIGDIVLSPDGTGNYNVGEVTGDYYYVDDGILPHRRPVKWWPNKVARSAMSDSLRNSTGSIGTISEITKYQEELEVLIGGAPLPLIAELLSDIEDPASFALERHLEDFLVQNWKQTELGKFYDIYEVDGEQVGQQYGTDTGPMDVLAISKDAKTLLVVELKKGRASDAVVGQVLRYMGYVQEELAEDHQTVRGVIIAMEDDKRIKRALAVTPSIDFYRYEISFKLIKA